MAKGKIAKEGLKKLSKTRFAKGAGIAGGARAAEEVVSNPYAQAALGAAEGALPPQLFASVGVDCDKECRAEIAAGAKDPIVDTDRVSEMQAQPVARPQLLGRAGSDTKHSASAVVSGRDEQQIPVSPYRRADVQAVVGLVRVPPQAITIVGIEPDDLFGGEHDELDLTVDVDQDR